MPYALVSDKKHDFEVNAPVGPTIHKLGTNFVHKWCPENQKMVLSQF